MEQKIRLRYIIERLQVGLTVIKHVYALSPALTSLHPAVYKGKLVYRPKGSHERISYDQIKRWLVKRRIVVREDVPNRLLV
jgi:hypothetical protein